MKKIFTVLSTLFALSTFAQTATNYGFEAWTTVPGSNTSLAYDTPNNWNSLNNLTSTQGVITCYKATTSSNVHGGSTAVKLVTKLVTSVSQIANGLITTGTINAFTSSVGGGVPYTLRPDSIIGWYKCAPMAGDSGFFEIQLLGSGGDTDTIGYAIFRTPGTTVATYTRFAKEIIYRNSNPVVKSIWIISSSRNNTTHIVNSTLYADDLQLGSDTWFAATNIDEITTSNLTVGPNPASTNIIINNPESINCIFNLYNIAGSIVKEEKIKSTSTSVNVSSLPNGVYIYSIGDANGIIQKTGKIVVQK